MNIYSVVLPITVVRHEHSPMLEPWMNEPFGAVFVLHDVASA